MPVTLEMLSLVLRSGKDSSFPTIRAFYDFLFLILLFLGLFRLHLFLLCLFLLFLYALQ